MKIMKIKIMKRKKKENLTKNDETSEIKPKLSRGVMRLKTKDERDFLNRRRQSFSTL